MTRSYYLFNPGRLTRKDKSLRFLAAASEAEPHPKAKYIPIESVEALYVYGSLDVNSALLNFLGQCGIHIHFFDYHEHYTGSFCPKEYLLAGKMQVEQSRAYMEQPKRVYIARRILEAAAWNMLHNIKYYKRRGKDMLENTLLSMQALSEQLEHCKTVPELMGIEGNIRQVYYSAFGHIVRDFEMGERSKRPPQNEINTLISFGNSMAYTMALDAIYHTQLNPTISFLHEPGFRRYSLALDLAEIFKPVLIDRCIFRVFNTGQLKAHHFEKNSDGCWLGDAGRKLFVRQIEEAAQETIQHSSLGRKVSYKYLMRLECYKLAKYILGMEQGYGGFRMR